MYCKFLVECITKCDEAPVSNYFNPSAEAGRDQYPSLEHICPSGSFYARFLMKEVKGTSYELYMSSIESKWIV